MIGHVLFEALPLRQAASGRRVGADRRGPGTGGGLRAHGQGERRIEVVMVDGSSTKDHHYASGLLVVDG